MQEKILPNDELKKLVMNIKDIINEGTLNFVHDLMMGSVEKIAASDDWRNIELALFLWWQAVNSLKDKNKLLEYDKKITRVFGTNTTWFSTFKNLITVHDLLMSDEIDDAKYILEDSSRINDDYLTDELVLFKQYLEALVKLKEGESRVAIDKLERFLDKVDLLKEMPFIKDVYKILLELHVSEKNTTKAKQIALDALEMPQVKQDPYFTIDLYKTLAKMYYMADAHEDAIKYYKLALKLQQELDLTKEIPKTLYALHLAYLYSGKYVSARNALREILEITNESDWDDEKLIEKTLSALSNINLLMLNVDETLETLKKMISLAEKKKDYIQLHDLMFKIALTYWVKERGEMSKVLLKKLFKKQGEYGYYEYKSVYLAYYAILLQEEGNLTLSGTYLRKASKYLSEDSTNKEKVEFLVFHVYYLIKALKYQKEKSAYNLYLDTIRNELSTALKYAEKTGMSLHQLQISLLFALFNHVIGKKDAAVSYLQRIIPIIRKSGHDLIIVELYILQAYILLQVLRTDSAKNALEQAKNIFTRIELEEYSKKIEFFTKLIKDIERFAKLRKLSPSIEDEKLKGFLDSLDEKSCNYFERLFKIACILI